MKLLEAIVEANHRAAAGDAAASVRIADHAGALPVAALTCIDPRLNRLIPEALGIPEEEFIWLRNAGNIITGPLTSTLRSLALACAIKGGREIVILGHTDCQVQRLSALQLTAAFQAMGLDRSRLPDNLTDYFGLFASERQNVIRAVAFVRGSPLIAPQIPVHGLMIDIETGRLEWIANGYQAIPEPNTAAAPPPADLEAVDPSSSLPPVLTSISLDAKVGDPAFGVEAWLARERTADATPCSPSSPTPREIRPPPVIPLPPPVIPRPSLRTGKR